MNLSDVTFRDPEFLYLLLLIPLLIFYHFLYQRKRTPGFKIPSSSFLTGTVKTFRQRTRQLPFFLRMMSLALFIFALARPQSGLSWRDVTTEGIDIILSLDISGSMLAEDFKPNRIDAAKKLAIEFIESRPNDRIGLVIFSGESFTQCPLTTDHEVLRNLFTSVKSGMIEDGTAIGMGIATAVNRLKDSEAKSKVIVLLTDGVNNSGLIAPGTAAELAAGLGIRIYTIGVGTHGEAPYPFRTPYGDIQYQNVPVEIDEKVMTDISAQTGGKYFRATGNRKLREVFQEIDKLEKTRIEVTEYENRKEEFLPFVMLGAMIFLIEMLLRYTYYRSLP